MKLSARHVLVLGLGISGQAMLRWCARQGAALLRGADSRAAPPRLDALRAELPALELQLGARGEDLLDGIDLVCVSPGIAPQDPAFGALLDAARARGIEVSGELGLFVAALHELQQSRGYDPALLAVTGTNGKTTVTSLTAHLLQGAGIDALAAGNIGPSLLDTLGQRLDALRLPQAWVLELSSFQLHGERGFAATAATVLNLTQDHLDWHGGMQAYAEAKTNIFGPQPWNLTRPAGVMLLNRDDAAVLALRRDGRRVQSFGLDAPSRDGDWGIVTQQGMAWLARARAVEDDAPPKRRARNAPPPPPAPVELQLLMPADALRIQGRHNWSNALAALALASAAGVALAPMLHALRSYRGEPHRMQSLGVIDDVEWIDDSKGTNVGATVAALQGLQRQAVLIAGGDGKGQDFAPLADAARGRVRVALLIGRDAARIGQALQGVCASESCASLEQAVQRAAQLAHGGDIVLLSPACASLDMFRDYAHRAAVFAAGVAELAAQRGAILDAGAA
jgi:UDP-N-acetylmuramoylalanine--D-glutamate ligase